MQPARRFAHFGGGLPMRESGTLIAESAYYCKHPMQQMAEESALALLDARAIPQLDAAE